MVTAFDSPAPPQVILIGTDALSSEALASCVGAELGSQVIVFSHQDSLRQSSSPLDPALIILSLRTQEACLGTLARLKDAGSVARVVVLSDSEEVEQIADILKNGASGYVPTSTPLNIAMKAIRLVLAGGVFVPSKAIVRKESAPKESLTARGQAVVELLRQGKSNRFIANTLNISESTVKTHVRNLMRQYQATNRVEIALKIRAQSAVSREETPFFDTSPVSVSAK
jgi:DNA-binding NarL/FixJ family response regulator